jgi:hypothetical protein
MMLRIALSRKEEGLDAFDKHYLDMLGFSLKSVENQLALVDGASEDQKVGRSRPTMLCSCIVAVKSEVCFLNQ